VRGRAEFFKLLVREDVDGDQVDFGVAVLAGLGGGHLNNLARAVLDDDEAVLPQSRALHRVRHRGAGIGALEGVLMLWTVQSAQFSKGYNRGDANVMPGRNLATATDQGGVRARNCEGPETRLTCASSAMAVNES
jgi:hypothetical protein